MTGIALKLTSASHNNHSALNIGKPYADTQANKVSITHCRFEDFTKNSITIRGGSATVSNNTIICGEYSNAAGNGIQVDYGATAVVNGNTITGYTSDTEWSATGILVLRGGKITEIKDNEISYCQIAICLTTDYDAEGDNTFLAEEAETANTFENCLTNVYRSENSSETADES